MRPESVPLGAGEARKPSIKVVGVGGAGCNAIASSSFESAAICTSIGHFKHIRTSKRFLLSEEQLLFLRDTDPRAIASIDHEWKDALVRTVGEADLIFVFTGLGGETGSFAAPAVSQICRKLSSLVITSIALPFSVEGKDRQRMAMLGLTHAFDSSDMTITYPNDCLLKMVPNLPFRKAFSIMDDIMMIPPMEMERVLTVEDLHRVRTAFSSSRHTRLGVGAATGDGRELRAVDEAFCSPWFDFPMDRVGAALVIVSAAQADDSTVSKVLADVECRLPNAKIRYAGRSDPLLGDKLKVTLLLGIPKT